jgi:type VI protein secretion system component VasF
MSAEPSNDPDRAAIEAHAQRTVEQTALRKVRKALDRMEEADARRRRMLRKALMLCALLAVLGVWYFWELVFGGDDPPKDPPLKVPGAQQQKR